MRYEISDQTLHWKIDSAYTSQVNYDYNTPCVLEVYPDKAPGIELQPGESFTSVRSFELLMDTEFVWNEIKSKLEQKKEADFESLKKRWRRQSIFGRFSYQDILKAYQHIINYENQLVFWLEKTSQIMKLFCCFCLGEHGSSGGRERSCGGCGFVPRPLAHPAPDW